MASPSGFRSLLLVRVLTVLNDNLLRWLAIGLGKRAAGAAGTALVLALGTAGFVLPFIVLAWLAGWLADRYPKRSVIAWGKFAEILIAAVAVGVVAWGAGAGGVVGRLPVGLWLLLGVLGVIGIQAAILAPSVLGSIAETVPPERLSAANGVFAMVSLVATLAGMAGGNWLADVTPLSAVEASSSAGIAVAGLPFAGAAPAALTLVGVAVVGWLAAFGLPRVAAADPHAPPPWNAVSRTCGDLAEVFRDRSLAGAAAGIVFFWALAAIAQLNVDQFAFESGATTQLQIVPLLVALVGGIGLGSLVAGRLSKRGVDLGSKVDLGFVPVGAIVMAVACFALAWSRGGVFTDDAGTAARLAAPVAWLVLLGIGAGLFDVPLEAALQERSPPARRGAILAAVNLLVFSGMFAASLAYGGLRTPVGAAATPLVSARGLFALFGVCSLVAAGVAVWAAPRAALRILVRGLVAGLWRLRVRHEDLVPETGPAVVVANHLSWLDGFLLPLVCPRPLRMVVYGPNIQGRFLNMLADQWRFILFDPKPKSIGRALKAIQSGLAAGDAIGIFCEGGISRHGQILGFKRGLEWMLDRVEAPIVPLHIDGLWGSGLTFSEGRYFTKRPRRFRATWPRRLRRSITLTFGSPLPVGTHPNEARLALQELTASAVRERFTTWDAPGIVGPGIADPAAAAATAEAFDGACLVRRDDRMLSSISAADPLGDTLGGAAGRLLGIHAVGADPLLPAAELAAVVARERSTIWLARVEQVAAVAEDRAAAAAVARTVTALVMPIGSVAELPGAVAAAAAFRAACGIEPVVAFAPREAGGLVAMNTPPARAAADHEVTCRPETVGRVLNGVVVWPEARMRPRLGRPSLAAAGIPDDTPRSVVIGATLPRPGSGGSAPPRAVLLAASFDVDAEGFLVVRG